jgi:hypothetical protein
VAGLAGFLRATADPSAREKLLLDANNRVLMFGTEGIADAAVSAGLLRSRSN